MDRRGLCLLQIAGALAAAMCTGCPPQFTERAVNGITFYCPGIGNTDSGFADLTTSLRAAGYEGDIAVFLWTLSGLPLDQGLGPLARLRAGQLAGTIERYVEEYPGRPVNLVGLSAGTGVAIWAVEQLRGGAKVQNVVFLASSLSHNYDLSRAMPNIRGKIYCYYSKDDFILNGPMKITGSIDGKLLTDAAGTVGLTSARFRDRIENIPYSEEFRKYGYYGGHLDSTSPEFLRAVVSRHILDTDHVNRLRRGTPPPPADATMTAAVPAGGPSEPHPPR